MRLPYFPISTIFGGASVNPCDPKSGTNHVVPMRELSRKEWCDMESQRFINYYECPDDGTEWIMVWSCMCNDRCRTCRHEIEPYKSERPRWRKRK